MKWTQKLLFTMGLLPIFAGSTFAADPVINTPYNPATGIWIQQVGDLYPSASTTETVYYTRYSETTGAKALDYYYDGNGYLKLTNKRWLCKTEGADGIVHHPDGDLLVAGQDYNEVHKVSKTASSTDASSCVDSTISSGVKASTFHLMMDPNNKFLWSAGIPGNLVSYRADSTGALTKIRQVKISGSTTDITTLIWDADGQAYFTRSNNMGYDAQFGIISDTVCSSNTKPCPTENITGLKTKTLITPLPGAHGASFDEYSNTILLFGDTHIVQIDPATRKIVADVDLNKYLFSTAIPGAVGWTHWLLDQGTADHKGHIFVASNSGHLIFLDYTSNVNKRINDNILIHAQWIDNFLDDLAPMAGAGSDRNSATTNSGSLTSSTSRSSSGAVYEESSSSTAISSGSTISSSGSTGSSSGSTISSSGSTGSSSGSTISSSGSTGSSSGSTISSSGSTGSSSGSTGTSSGSTGSSSGSTASSSGSTGNSSGSTASSSGSTGSSSGSATSSSGTTGSGDEWVPPWVSDTTVYEGFDDDGSENGNTADAYPSNDKIDKGDTLITSGSVLIPLESSTSSATNIIVNGNTYVKDSSAATPLPGYSADTSSATGRDSAYVGDVIELVLDANKIKDYFGSAETLYVAGSSGLLFVDPSNPGTPSDSIAIAVTGDDLKLWVTANTVVNVGSIYFTDSKGNLIIFDGINFYDPIPNAELGYIQDADGNGYLDSLEVILADTLDTSAVTVTGLAVVVNGDTLAVDSSTIWTSGNRIYADASKLALSADSFPENAKVIVTYTSATGVNYQRETSLLELGSHVIKQAYAIRDKNGRDSLFVEFNIDIIPADLNSPEMIVFLNSLGLDSVNVYLPTKNMIIIVGDSLGLNGSSDYVTLASGAVFNNLSYIATSEYERQVPVTVTDRYPSATAVEYYDGDGNGELDSIVVRFSSTITQEDVDNFHFSFPWYSSRGLLINLLAQPADLVIGADGKSVSWIVRSNVNVASNLTSISSDVPKASLYTYYEIFGNTFVASEQLPVEDKMAPVISSATLHYGDGSSRDTLTVTFSEAVDYSSLSGNDFFAYIHGKDTIDLNPVNLVWAADGESVQLILREATDGIVPGDSLMIVKGDKSSILDIYGNESIENASPVVIGGLLGQIVKSVKMGTFDPEDYVASELNSVSISYMPNSTRTSDLEDEGVVGHLISLGERFVPQLIDGAKVDANGNYDEALLDSIDPADVSVNFSVSYFDNIGQYVADTTISIPCNSPAFGADQNCLTSDSNKVFVNWNYKDHTGRLVGTGVYIVQFKLVVRYKQKKIEEELRDKWGVRRRTGK